MLRAEIAQIQGFMGDGERRIAEASSREDRLLREFPQVVQAWEEELVKEKEEPKCSQ